MKLAPDIQQQFFALAPAEGRPALDESQRALLIGKSRWIHESALSGLPTCPTIAITRAAWRALTAEQGAPAALREKWVRTLFQLVPSGQKPPPLVVRTSAGEPRAGIAPARLDVAPPASPSESVRRDRPLGKAIDQALASYGVDEPLWADPGLGDSGAGDLVLVQSLARGRLVSFLTRNPLSGDIGPVPAPRGAALPESQIAPAREVAEAIDRIAGNHMEILAELRGDRLNLVSARPVQANAHAILEAARDRVERGHWSPREAVGHIDPNQLVTLLHPRLRDEGVAVPISTGLGVSPGAASGEIVFSAEDAARMRARGRHCILVAMETGPADIEGMQAATGILTARGGVTSHAAVIARITGKPCVTGVRALQIQADQLSCRIGDQDFRAGDKITIDGTAGQVFEGALALSRPQIGGAISKLLDWADGNRTIQVRTNVETVEAARTALSFGAEGIGLARSEHMFFSSERLPALRRLILSESEDDRRAALEGLIDYQTGDYAELFATMPGKPVTVRLFDPPLHEFLPRGDEDIEETAKSLGLAVTALRQRLQRLEEINPMLGHRGCRLAITYPEILAMQVRAMAAGLARQKTNGSESVQLEIMVPFVSTAREVAWLRASLMDQLAGVSLPDADRQAIQFGTMIELPRAALRAGDIAPQVDFISFGTNDLTQTTFGISRDDAPAFLASYRRKRILSDDPFVTIDRTGVGELIGIAIERGKAANPNLKVGICGEHAGDPRSLAFLAGLPIDYVSCAPYRVPVARLVLAQQSGQAN